MKLSELPESTNAMDSMLLTRIFVVAFFKLVGPLFRSNEAKITAELTVLEFLFLDLHTLA